MYEYTVTFEGGNRVTVWANSITDAKEKANEGKNGRIVLIQQGGVACGV